MNPTRWNKNTFQKEILGLLILVMSLLSVNATCQNKTSDINNMDSKVEKKDKKEKKYKLPKIDLSQWSVTTPELNTKGAAMNNEPPAILMYATDES